MNGQARTSFGERADQLGRTIETILLAFVLSAMILVAAGQIVLRNIWGTGFDWADEALRVMVLWVTMLGAVAASREHRHVRIDAMLRYVSRRVSRWSGVLVDGFTALVGAALAWYSYQFVADSWLAHDRVLGGELPAWSVQLILPVGFALISYRYAVACLKPRDARVDDVVDH